MKLLEALRARITSTHERTGVRPTQLPVSELEARELRRELMHERDFISWRAITDSPRRVPHNCALLGTIAGVDIVVVGPE